MTSALTPEQIDAMFERLNPGDPPAVTPFIQEYYAKREGFRQAWQARDAEIAELKQNLALAEVAVTPRVLPEQWQALCEEQNKLIEIMKRGPARELAARDAEIAAKDAKIAELEQSGKESDWQIEALDMKVSALTAHATCGCSYDHKDDICMHHSPKLVRALTEIAELRKQLEWQPIETAPKDGTEILAYRKRDVKSCRWKGDCWGGDGWTYPPAEGMLGEHAPTHWKPLPAPPEQGEG